MERDTQLRDAVPRLIRQLEMSGFVLSTGTFLLKSEPCSRAF